MIFCCGLPFYSWNTNEVSSELVPSNPVALNVFDQSLTSWGSFLWVSDTQGLERQDCRTPVFSRISTTDDRVKGLLVARCPEAHLGMASMMGLAEP